MIYRTEALLDFINKSNDWDLIKVEKDNKSYRKFTLRCKHCGRETIKYDASIISLLIGKTKRITCKCTNIGIKTYQKKPKELWKKREKQIPMIDCNCDCCGKSFKAYHKNQHFCSQECNRLWWKQSKRLSESKKQLNAKKKVEALDKNIEYISGYKSRYDLITIRCKRCGTERKVVYATLRGHYYQKKVGNKTYDFCAKCRVIPKAQPKSTDLINKELVSYGYEYVDGYKGAESMITVRHAKCGRTFKCNYHNMISMLRGNKDTGHYECLCCRQDRKDYKRMLKDQANRLKQQQIAKANEEHELYKSFNKFCRLNRIYIKQCKECGITFYTHKRTDYCSDKHKKRHANRIDYLRFERRFSGKIVDKDITLEKLYKKNKGKCYLCGGKCNWNDYKKMIGNDGKECIIVGGTYPSIEHVIPLSKGGLHEWDNVNLAHKRCNEIKSDNLIISTQQTKLFNTPIK